MPTAEQTKRKVRRLLDQSAKTSIDAILERLRPYVSADDAVITDVGDLARLIANRAADDRPSTDEPHEFRSKYGAEFCDVCGHSILGHD